MQYKTTKQFGSGREMPDKIFKNLNEAKEHVQQAAIADAAMKIKATYRVYEFDDVIHEVNSATVEILGKPADDSTSSSAKGSGSTFNPSPLMTSAKPKGAVQHWKREDDEDE